VVFSTGEENTNEELFTDAKGVTHTIITKKTLYRNKDNVSTLVGIIRDVTDIRASEAALRASEERLRSITSVMTDVVCRVDTNGIIRYVSEAAERILGYTSSEIIGRYMLEFAHEDDRPKIMEAFQKMLVQGGFITIEARVRSKDGKTKTVEIRSVGIRFGGVLTEIQGVIREITPPAQA
jgi:PAS domain S-box-containing protein